jgi:LuxR family maltose regulon positive regulatory protein
MAYCAVLSLLELTELRLSEADIEGAVTSFESARVAEQDAELVGDRTKLARVGASVELAKGNPAAAQAWAEQLDEPFWTPVTTARVLLAREDRSGALTAARSATPRCARHRVVLDLLWARLARSGDEAIEFVTRAVTEAAAHGMRQTVASEDAGVLALVERVAWVVPADWVDAVRRLAATSHRTSGYEPALPPATLSQREREVLRFLPSRLTAQEIAVELGISVNTLKYHIKTIYRKLGVNSRAEAAELVRHGGVLRSTAESRGPRRA